MKKNVCWAIPFTFIFLIIQFIISLINPPSVIADSGSDLVQGKLDLHSQVIANDGPFELTGEWEFYWKQLRTPEDGRPLSSNTVPVPDSWNNYTHHGQLLPRYGYGTFHLTLILNKEDIGQVVSLYMPNVATAYRLFVNENLLASNGQVGKTRQQMIPKSYAKVVTFEVERPRIELLLQVSNFHQRKSGLWEPISFGTADQITEIRERNILFQAFVIGCIFIIGFYHIVMFFQRTRDLSPLFLALACFGVALRTLLLKDTLLINLFPQINWEISVGLEYLSALMALLFFLLFVGQQLSLDMPRSVIKWFVAIVILYSFFVVVTPARVFTNTFIFFQLLASSIMLSIVVVSFLGIARKREGAYLNLMAMLVLFTAVLNDLFYYSNWISTDEFVSIGLLFYLFTQSIHLARRSSRSFDKVEKLSENLHVLNQSLEKRVENRTEELQVANSSLQKIEKSRRRLLANVSHELNTPLTFIQGYIKAMMDGVVSKDDSTYLRTVYDDTQMMAHMIRDLQELSKLESGQVTFQFKKVEMRTFLSQLYEEQKPVVFEKKIHFQYKERLHCTSEGAPFFCLLDPIRIKQAYMNLVINAQKFTPSGGTVTVEVENSSSATRELLKVSVIDKGAGIAKKDLPFIFERFYKGNQLGSEEDRGAGLGLAIVKEIIENHKGSVGVESEQGKGSSFFFTLPIQNVKKGSQHDDKR